MSKRPLIYLGIVLAIAVIVFLIERPDRPWRGDVSDERVFVDYDAERITRIEIGQILSGVQLKREGKSWLVADRATPMRLELLAKEGKQAPEVIWFPADRSVVGSALGVFGDFRRGVVVSTNPENQKVYHVSGPLGLNVRLYEGDEKVVDVTIGKQSRNLSGNYVRVGDSDEVTLSDRRLAQLFPTAVPDWRDRTIWRIDPKEVTALTVERPAGSYELVRNDGTWKLTKGGSPIDEKKVEQLIRKLSAIYAAGFASADDPRTQFKRPAIQVTLATKDGKTYELDVGGSNNLKQYYARRAGDEQVYLVGALDALIPEDPKDLK